MKKIIYFIAPFLIGMIFLLGLDRFFDHNINKLLKDKDLTPIMNDSLSTTKDKGLAVNNHFLKKEDIMMLGSSELGHSTKQHPTYYFNNNKSKNGVFTIGRAYTQNLQDATILGSTDTNIKNKKVVLLVSMQWFMDKEGVTKNHYQTRFSPVQFYNFLDNPKISRENKVKFTKRAGELLIGSGEYKPEAIYANLYDSDTLISKIIKTLLNPYFQGRRYFVEFKDKGLLYKELLSLPDKKVKKQGEPFNWEYEKEKAIKDAKKRVGKNELKIDKKYFEVNFGDNLNKLKDRDKDVNLMESKELEDYKFFLDICEDLGVKPVIVMLPSMEKFYNLTGISTEERHELYDEIAKLSKDKGFKSIDLRSKETEDYYLRDVMHLGTKGWVDVCEKLFKEFNQ